MAEWLVCADLNCAMCLPDLSLFISRALTSRTQRGAGWEVRRWMGRGTSLSALALRARAFIPSFVMRDDWRQTHSTLSLRVKPIFMTAPAAKPAAAIAGAITAR